MKLAVLSFTAILLAAAIDLIAAECDPIVLKDLGCWKDSGSRSMTQLNSLDADLLNDRSKVIQRCAKAAQRRGYKVFGVQNGRECFSSPIALRNYKKFGRGRGCTTKGSVWHNKMYEVPSEKLGSVSFPVKFKSLGCWKDTGTRAIPTIEGKDKILDRSYSRRTEAFRKCYEATRRRGYKVFALQNGGWCTTSATAKSTYKKYGASSACKIDGEGGVWANEVYEITE